MEFWFIAVALFVLVVFIAAAAAVIANLLVALSRLPDDNHDYINDWTKK